MLWNAEVLMDVVRIEIAERHRAAEQERLARTVVSTWLRRKPASDQAQGGRPFIVG